MKLKAYESRRAERDSSIRNIDPQKIRERSPLLSVPLTVGMTTGGREHGTPYAGGRSL